MARRMVKVGELPEGAKFTTQDGSQTLFRSGTKVEALYYRGGEPGDDAPDKRYLDPNTLVVVEGTEAAGPDPTGR